MLCYSKGELRYGKLLFRKKHIVNNKTHILEQVQFKNAIECTKYYNKLVAEFARKSQANTYSIDSWTQNYFSFKKYEVEVYRFGNIIQLTKIQKENLFGDNVTAYNV